MYVKIHFWLNLVTWGLASSEITALRTENKQLSEKLHHKQDEVLRLETQMIPFRIEALRRFPGTEHEALAKLASQLHELETSIEVIREYSDMARLDALGKPYADGDIVFNTPISRMLEGTYKKNQGKLEFRRDRDGELTFRAVINNHPRFPFAYYFLAMYLKDHGNPEWRIPAQHAMRLLQKTTQVAGHHSHHDEVLQRLQVLMKGEGALKTG